MGKRNSRNPTSNSVLQALLDLADSGHGTMTVDQMISRLSSDSKLRTAMQKKWDAHAYPEDAMEWAQLTKAQQLLTLSDTALKVLTCMGLYAHQSTLLQVSYRDLAVITEIKDRSLRTAIRELINTGCIRIEVPSIQHAAPIYSVNPAIINKGTRRKSAARAYNDKLDGCQDYILQRTPKMLASEETIRQVQPDGRKLVYNRLRPVPPSNEQMSIEDFPEYLPGEEGKS